MIVLGIDPGTRVTGYGAVRLEDGRLSVVEYGAIRARSDTIAQRLREVFEGLQAVIETVRPDTAAVEEAFFGRNVQSTIKIGEARAVALLAAALAGIPIAEYSAKTVKKSVVGVGSAHKSQVGQMVQRILGMEEPPRPADAADALAIALCHCHRIHTSRGRGAAGNGS
jgi:crossover junction endodeoxyribonuclease RuvC